MGINNDADLTSGMPGGDDVRFLKIKIGANSVSASRVFLSGNTVEPMEFPMEIEKRLVRSLISPSLMIKVFASEFRSITEAIEAEDR